MKERTWDGKVMQFRDDHAELFDKAAELAKSAGTIDQIVNLLCGKDSPIYRDAQGQRIDGIQAIKTEVYAAVKAMIRARGVADGMLKETAECSRPSLDDFRAKN